MVDEVANIGETTAPERTLVRIEPGTFIAWGYDNGGCFIAQLHRAFFELPHDGFFIGQWTNKPDVGEVKEAAKLIRAVA